MTSNGPASPNDERVADELGATVDRSDNVATYWVDPHTADHAAIATGLGLAEHRRLHQMRIPLPLPPVAASGAAPTRALRRPDDIAGWVATNNAAFDWHPDQGGWTAARFRDALSTAAVPDDDVRILDDPDATRPPDGGVGGFCWTKVHPATAGDDSLGEIYVIAAHPALHGQGYGRGLTVAGLVHLWQTYATPVGMLYVEADNTAAVGLYQSMGFEVHHDNVAYRRAHQTR